MTSAPVPWQRTAEVVAAWLAAPRSLRDVIAADTRLRNEPTAVRAAVARLALAVVAAKGRLEYALPEGRNAGSHALALVLAHLVESSRMPADDAHRAFGQVSREYAPDFRSVGSALANLHLVADPDRRFAIRHSMPEWAAVRLLREFGDDADAVAAALGAPPPRTIRTNLLRCASRAELAAALAAEGVATRDTPWSAAGLFVDGDSDLFATSAYAKGWFEQQDEASQLAAELVLPPPGGRVLDLCAGSGGKTLAIAAALRNRGEVVATDVHGGRLSALRERARRAGAGNVRAIAIDEGQLPDQVRDFAARADRILVDAPCSGIGSWRRRPEARWSIAATALPSLVATQDRLADVAAALLQPGARLVYATCSLLREENEGVIERLVSRRRELEIVRVAELFGSERARPIADATGTFLSLRPDRHATDGFFAAVVRRRRQK